MRIGFWRAKTHKASEITEGKFPLERLGWTDEKLLKGAGAGVAPEEIDLFAAGGGIAVFGDGSDGDVTVNADPFTSGTLIVDNVLQRDAFFDNLTVENTRLIVANGYRIFAKGTLTNAGTIERNGNDAHAPDQTAGEALTAGSLGGSAAGSTNQRGCGAGGGGGGVLFIAARIIVNTGTISANGGNGLDAFADAATNNNGPAGNPITSSLGANGGQGGDSNDTFTGGDGGAATAPTAVKGGFRAPPFAVILKEIESTVVKIAGGAGGGAGGAGANAANKGGGGGGGGGCLIIIYNSLTSGTETANGGVGSAGLGVGDSGANGSNGEVILLPNA